MATAAPGADSKNIGNRTTVEGRRLTPEEAGAKLAEHLDLSPRTRRHIVNGAFVALAILGVFAGKSLFKGTSFPWIGPPDLPNRLSCSATLPAIWEDGTMHFDFKTSPPTVLLTKKSRIYMGSVGSAKGNAKAFRVNGGVDIATGRIESVPSGRNLGWTVSPLSRGRETVRVKVESWESGQTAEFHCLGLN
jgi:hypothetical protein